MGSLFLLGLLLGAAWWVQLGEWGWRLGLYAGLLGLTAALAAQSWLATSAGVLRWQSGGWTWSSAQGTRPGAVTLALDFQAVMLLTWRSDAGESLWLWLERRTAPSDWRALRRAVVARSRPQRPDAEGSGRRWPEEIAP